MLCQHRFLNVLNISHQQISSFKHTQLMLSNVCYSFDQRTIKNKQRKARFHTNKNSLVFYFRITKTDLAPFAQTMYDSFFRILTSDKSYENEYVMRATMRLSSSLQENLSPYLNHLMDKLVMILRRSCKVNCLQLKCFCRRKKNNYLQNPNKPNFNHYLFETITVLIRTSLIQNPAIIQQFEQTLFPVFTPIFTDDIAGKRNGQHSNCQIENCFVFVQNLFLMFCKSLDFSWNHIRKIRYRKSTDRCSNQFQFHHFGIVAEIFPLFHDFYKHSLTKLEKQLFFLNQ